MNKTPNAALSHRVANASSLSIMGKFIGRGFDLITLAILSRLLSPADFGLMALAMIGVTIVESVTELPLNQALVRVVDPTREMYDTAFTLAFLRGAALVVILCAAAVGMSLLYHEPRLVALMSALSLAPILRGTLNPRMAAFIRQLDFWQLVGIEVAGKAVALVVSSIIAFTTRSYWAIASATICTPLVMNALSYGFVPYVPRFRLSEWPIFSNVVAWNSLSQLVATMNWQLDRLFLGYFVPKSSLGRYAMSSDVATIPVQAIVVPLGNPLFAAYSLRGEESQSVLTATYLKGSNAVLAIGGPILLGLSLLSVPVVRLVLGPAWKETGELLQWFALINIITLPVYHVGGLALSLNQARMMTWRTVGEFIVAMPTLFFGTMYFGIPGIIAARAFTMLVVLILGMEAVRHLVFCSILSQAMALRRTFIALGALALAVLMLRPFVVGDGSPLVLTVSLAAVSAVGSVVYIVALYLLWMIEGRPEGIERVVWERSGIYMKRLKEAL